MNYPGTADEAAHPALSGWQVPLVFPLETPQYWGYFVAGPKEGAANSRESIESGDGAACKWQHRDTLMMRFPLCHLLPCTETKEMFSQIQIHFPPKLDCLFHCKDRRGNENIEKTGWTPSVCGWRV